MKLWLSLCLFLGFAMSAYSQTFTCPSGTEDMMNYFLMAYPNRVDNFVGPGNANPIYSTVVPELGNGYATQGYFLWIKSVNGYPWDIKSFDASYVYDRATELNWNDPQSFKRFNQDLPMSTRCVPVGKAGKTIRIVPANAAYSFYASCSAYQTGQLGYVYNTISAPVAVNTGNIGQVQTRYFKYHYGCDSSYSHCTDMEVFSLGYQVGLFDWKHYVKQNGTWSLKQDSVINHFTAGQTTPSLPCTTSYQ